MSEYKPRTLGSHHNLANSMFPVLLVTGPRQVGKTTFLQHNCESDRQYVTLDDPVLRALAIEDPALFLQRFKPPVLIDEIQYAPQLFPHIKMVVDRNKKTGQFWLTGSQQFLLIRDLTESLAGRVGILRLQGMSQAELAGQTDLPPFLPSQDLLTHREACMSIAGATDLQRVFERIWRGSFPVVALNDSMDHAMFFGSYLQTYLQRDVRDLARVGDEQAFLRFLRTAAARTGQLVNYADLARDADVAPATAKSWLSILQTSGLVYLLEPYHTNITKRLVKAPKLYFLDTGLCAYLTGWTSSQTLEAGAMSGAVLESYILAELLKSYWHAGQDAPFFFYRDRDKKEVDLLIVRDGTIYPLEFKKTAQPDRRVAKQISIVNKLGLPVGHGAVICLISTCLPITAEVSAYPVAWV